MNDEFLNTTIAFHNVTHENDQIKRDLAGTVDQFDLNIFCPFPDKNIFCEISAYDDYENSTLLWHRKFWGCIHFNTVDVTHRNISTDYSLIIARIVTDGAPLKILDFILSKYPNTHLVMKIESPDIPPTYYSYCLEDQEPKILSDTYIQSPLFDLFLKDDKTRTKIKDSIRHIEQTENQCEFFIRNKFGKYSGFL